MPQAHTEHQLLFTHLIELWPRSRAPTRSFLLASTPTCTASATAYFYPSTLLLDQAVSPPRLQAFAGLDNVLSQMVSLRGNELLCTAEDSLALG